MKTVLKNNPYLDHRFAKRRERRFGRGSGVCAAVEADIAELDDDERDEFGG